VKISHRVVDPNIQVVAVSGRFTIGEDSQEAERIVDTLLAKKERRFVFDLLEADFIDSSCLGILVSCLRKPSLRSGGARGSASPRVAASSK
jgi:anti-anti-sigma regulatory factor